MEFGPKAKTHGTRATLRPLIWQNLSRLALGCKHQVAPTQYVCWLLTSRTSLLYSLKVTSLSKCTTTLRTFGLNAPGSATLWSRLFCRRGLRHVNLGSRGSCKAFCQGCYLTLSVSSLWCLKLAWQECCQIVGTTLKRQYRYRCLVSGISVFVADIVVVAFE